MSKRRNRNKLKKAISTVKRASELKEKESIKKGSCKDWKTLPKTSFYCQELWEKKLLKKLIPELWLKRTDPHVYTSKRLHDVRVIHCEPSKGAHCIYFISDKRQIHLFQYLMDYNRLTVQEVFQKMQRILGVKPKWKKKQGYVLAVGKASILKSRKKLTVHNTLDT